MHSGVIKAVVSVFLLGVLSIPVVIPAIHTAVEDHDHATCDVTDGIHHHEEEHDCALCDYLIGLQTFHKDDEEEHVASPPYELASVCDQVKLSCQQLGASPVRGPPSMC